MKELLTWGISTGLLLLTFVMLIIVGLIKKKKTLIYISILIFFLAGFVGLRTAFLVTRIGFNKISSMVKPRTGDQIYSALFASPRPACVKVLNYQDQIVPRIDYAIWLEFTTCPSELRRIATQRQYSISIQSTNDWHMDGPLAHENWFKPESLGDSVIVFHHEKNEFGEYVTLYSNLDSTHAFFIDVAD